MAASHRIELRHAGRLRACVLHDDLADLHATWIPGAGMLGASLRHRGEELLWTGSGVSSYARRRVFMGIPLLHPWANRLASYSYRAGGRAVSLDRSSPVLLRDDNGLPIHGVLTACRHWRVDALAADGECARLTAVLDFDRPELLDAFPFPHRLEMEVRLGDSSLELRTTVTATGADAVPVAFGFHPYLRIPGLPRARWSVSFPVHRRLELDERLIPTGAAQPVLPIKGRIGHHTWDDGFDQVEQHSQFILQGKGRTIAVQYTDGYPVAQIFAPPNADYICIEPMTVPANALAGPDEVLEWVRAGESRGATFRIECRHHNNGRGAALRPR